MRSVGARGATAWIRPTGGGASSADAVGASRRSEAWSMCSDGAGDAEVKRRLLRSSFKRLEPDGRLRRLASPHLHWDDIKRNL
eukprot:480052-Prymnesium_polylepis.1